MEISILSVPHVNNVRRSIKRALNYLYDGKSVELLNRILSDKDIFYTEPECKDGDKSDYIDKTIGEINAPVIKKLISYGLFDFAQTVNFAQCTKTCDILFWYTNQYGRRKTVTYSGREEFDVIDPECGAICGLALHPDDEPDAEHRGFVNWVAYILDQLKGNLYYYYKNNLK